jgi:hypothetical protein
MDYNHLFIPGQEISAFVKDSNRIWEGIIVDRYDGTKVVLNEDTKRWKKLSDLESIKRTGHLLYEDQQQEIDPNVDNTPDTRTNQLIGEILGKGALDDSKVAENADKFLQKQNDVTKAGKVAYDLSKQPDIKGGPFKSEDDATKAVGDNAKKIKAEAAGDATGGGDVAQQEAEVEALKQQYESIRRTNDTLSQLHPSLQPALREMAASDFKQIKTTFIKTQDEAKAVKALRLAGLEHEHAEKTVQGWKAMLMQGIDIPLNESKLIEDYDYDEDLTEEEGDYMEEYEYLQKIKSMTQDEVYEEWAQTYIDNVKESDGKFYNPEQYFENQSEEILSDLHDCKEGSRQMSYNDARRGALAWWNEHHGELNESIEEDDLIDFIRDQTEAGKFERKDFEKIKDYMQDNDAAGTADEEWEDENGEGEKADAKESLDYEDSEYLDIPDDVKADVIAKCKELLAAGQDDIEDEIKSSFELADDDAEEFIIQAMEEFLEETEVVPRESIKDHEEDEVEKDFEDTIDQFEGPDGELLDHLVDEYEIEPGEAEKVYEESSSLSECIFKFVEIVRNRLD